AALGRSPAERTAATAQGRTQARRAATQERTRHRARRPRAFFLATHPGPALLSGQEIRAGEDPAGNPRPDPQGHWPCRLGTRSRPGNSAPAAQLLRAAAAKDRKRVV